MTEAVAESGFASVTARGLTARAGVSTRSLYENFSSLQACLAEAHSLTVSSLLDDLARAGSGAADDEARVRRVVGALVSALADDHAAAHLLLAELPGAGPTAIRQARLAWRRLGERLAESTGLDPRRADLPPHYLSGLAAGVLGVARARLLVDGLDDLRSPDLVESLSRWVLALRDVPTPQLRQLDRLATRRAADLELSAPVPSSKHGAMEEGADAYSGDRALLRAAALRLAADGCHEIRVEDLCALAGISRGRFRRCFESVDACLVEAIEEGADAALARARTCAAEGRGSVPRAVASLAADLARPGYAALAECGDRGMRSREVLIARTAGLLDAQLPPATVERRLTVTASAAAVWGELEAEAAAEEAGRSPAGRAYLVLAPLTGPDEALAALAGGKDLGTTTREETHP
jgi:AcrR family transcriptional regulator